MSKLKPVPESSTMQTTKPNKTTKQPASGTFPLHPKTLNSTSPAQNPAQRRPSRLDTLEIVKNSWAHKSRSKVRHPQDVLVVKPPAKALGKSTPTEGNTNTGVRVGADRELKKWTSASPVVGGRNLRRNPPKSRRLEEYEETEREWMEVISEVGSDDNDDDDDDDDDEDDDGESTGGVNPIVVDAEDHGSPTEDEDVRQYHDDSQSNAKETAGRVLIPGTSGQRRETSKVPFDRGLPGYKSITTPLELNRFRGLKRRYHEFIASSLNNSLRSGGTHLPAGVPAQSGPETPVSKSSQPPISKLSPITRNDIWPQRPSIEPLDDVEGDNSDKYEMSLETQSDIRLLPPVKLPQHAIPKTSDATPRRRITQSTSRPVASSTSVSTQPQQSSSTATQVPETRLHRYPYPHPRLPCREFELPLRLACYDPPDDQPRLPRRTARKPLHADFERDLWLRNIGATATRFEVEWWCWLLMRWAESTRVDVPVLTPLPDFKEEDEASGELEPAGAAGGRPRPLWLVGCRGGTREWQVWTDRMTGGRGRITLPEDFFPRDDDDDDDQDHGALWQWHVWHTGIAAPGEPAACHWDHLLEGVRWLAGDFRAERRELMALAAWTAGWCRWAERQRKKVRGRLVAASERDGEREFVVERDVWTEIRDVNDHSVVGWERERQVVGLGYVTERDRVVAREEGMGEWRQGQIADTLYVQGEGISEGFTPTNPGHSRHAMAESEMEALMGDSSQVEGDTTRDALVDADSAIAPVATPTVPRTRYRHPHFETPDPPSNWNPDAIDLRASSA